jgi:hypothetical protein
MGEEYSSAFFLFLAPSGAVRKKITIYQLLSAARKRLEALPRA